MEKLSLQNLFMKETYASINTPEQIGLRQLLSEFRHC